MNRKHTRLLVESILKGNTQKADRILAKLITEAEDDREDQAADEANTELGIQPQEEDGQDSPDDAPEGDDEFDDIEDSDDEFESLDDDTAQDPVGDEEFGSPQETEIETDSEINDLVDKQVNFECQINNLVLNDLINQVADLKTALENNSSFDKHSREFYEIKVPLQYYSETLLKIQKNITPLVNQDEIKKQLDEIDTSLQELSDKIGVSNDVTSISTPDEIIDQDISGTQF